LDSGWAGPAGRRLETHDDPTNRERPHTDRQTFSIAALPFGSCGIRPRLAAAGVGVAVDVAVGVAVIIVVVSSARPPCLPACLWWV
jgi:hypothetical protein